MNVELGMLVENDGMGKLAVVKIDQVNKQVILEKRETNSKLVLTFDEFEEIFGIKTDKRQLLRG